tara:strand:+ start:1213 stop:1818 length:606 start_codon:yes stop_codon:yes gene_type:complete
MEASMYDDLVLPPDVNPYYQPGRFVIPPKETSPEEIICRGKREGMECGLPKMYPNQSCSDKDCSKYREKSKSRGDAGGDSGREASSWTCARIDEEGNVCGAEKSSARSRCSKLCRGLTQYEINKRKKQGKSRRPKALGVDEASVHPRDIACASFLDNAAKLKSKKKRRNTKKRKHKKNHSKKKKITKKRKHKKKNTKKRKN